MRIGRTAAVTDTGRKRLRNEDAHVFEPPLFAIADGMGGARAGEVAAGLAVATLEDARSRLDGEASLQAVIADANRRVWERSVTDPATAGMGTTVTVALVDEAGERVAFAHVGDSRAYLLRGDDLEQVTTDHSLVNELVQSGVLTREEAERHPQRAAITRAVGTDHAIEADVFSVPAETGDVFLLCSDGLTDMLSKDEIAAAVLSADRAPEAAAKALVEAANERGGEDNITVVLFELVEGDPEGVAPQESTTMPSPESSAVVAGEAPDDLRTHGAGPGGRVAALMLVAALVVLGLLAVYWGITK